ncbi:hypothetical protein PENTCL1PPCAC_14029, partial [Pristionchus entomophagus]
CIWSGLRSISSSFRYLYFPLHFTSKCSLCSGKRMLARATFSSNLYEHRHYSTFPMSYGFSCLKFHRTGSSSTTIYSGSTERSKFSLHTLTDTHV